MKLKILRIVLYRNMMGSAETVAVEGVNLESFRAHVDINFFGVVNLT
jgi:hypothetical protein